ncbi:MAG: GyrI-like domain-containing protein [Gemmataceae bacterium]
MQVNVVRVEAQPTAVVRFEATRAELPRLIQAACGETWNFAKTAPGLKPGRHVAVYLKCLTDIECGVEVAGPFEGNGRVVPSSTPAGLAATATHIGPYHLLAGVHEAITRWCAANGHKLAGPSWEVYGHGDVDPAKFRIDVYYLLAEPAE